MRHGQDNFNRIIKLTARELEIAAALMLALDYVDVGIIEINRAEFAFTLRGPLFWRLTSGMPPYLHSPSQGLNAIAYLRIEALLAYLLLISEAHIENASAAASITVWTVRSPWFRWQALRNLLQQNPGNFRYHRAVLMLLNMGIGSGLVSLTAVNHDKFNTIKFFTSAAPLQRSKLRLPSKLTLPLMNSKMNSKLHWLNIIIGSLMIIRQLYVDGVAMGRGGEIGFVITGDVFDFKVIPQYMSLLANRRKT
jgi:hypothetical protein